MDLAPIGDAATILAVSKAAEPYLLKVLGAPLEQIGGLLASPLEEMRKRRAARLTRIAAAAAAQVQEAGAEPIQIPDYLAIPILEKATLVDDEDLQQMWSSLLASASHPVSAPDVSHAFPTMLAGLSARDAQFLDVWFSAAVRAIFIKIRPIAASTIASHSRSSEEQLSKIVKNSPFRWRSMDEKLATLQHLVNLGILQRDLEIPRQDLPKLTKYVLDQVGITPNKRIEVDGNLIPQAKNFYTLTIPGTALLIACKPLSQRP